MWFVLLMSCGEAPAKTEHHHVSVSNTRIKTMTAPTKAKQTKSEKKAPTAQERMVEMKSDMGEAKDDLSCIKTFLQCREDGSQISFEDYELQHCQGEKNP